MKRTNEFGITGEQAEGNQPVEASTVSDGTNPAEAPTGKEKTAVEPKPVEEKKNDQMETVSFKKKYYTNYTHLQINDLTQGRKNDDKPFIIDNDQHKIMFRITLYLYITVQ